MTHFPKPQNNLHLTPSQNADVFFSTKKMQCLTSRGPTCLKSKNIGNAGFLSSSYTTISTRMHGPSTMTFYWRVDSEAGYDYLSFYDGTSSVQISGQNAGWAYKEVYFEAGLQI